MAINIRQSFVLEDKEFSSQITNGGNMDFYTKILKEFECEKLSFMQYFDGIITGGIGSSAAAAVALVGAIAKYKDIKYDQDEIAKVAWNIEVNKMGLFGGKQDQWAAAWGGVNVFQFSDTIKTTQLGLSFIKPVLPSILLFHTGKNRKDSKIQESYLAPDNDQIRYLDLIKAYTLEALDVIPKGDIKKFGELIDLSWEAKKNSNIGVSNTAIDKLMKKAKKLGAYGGKIMGAGGGGYCFFVVPIEKQRKFIENIGIKQIDYSIDWNGLDCRII